MANLIQIKRSLTTATAPSLANGELAFTANGDHLFIGSNGASITIAGKFNPGVLTANQALVANGTGYLDAVKAANLISTGADITNLNVGGSKVLANATQLTVAAGVGLSANGSLGSANQVLRSTGTSIYWDTDAGDISGVTAGNGLTGGGTSGALTIDVVGANGINVTADAVGVTTGSTLTVNTTGIHVNSSLALTSLSLTGDLTVAGNLTTTNVNSVVVSDPLIYLAGNNYASDLVDIGFAGNYNDGSNRHTGLFRDASDSGIYKLFYNLTQELDAATTVNTADPTFAIATLQTYLNSGGLVSNSTAVTLTANSTLAVNLTANSVTLNTPLAVTSGGIGRSSITAGAILVGNGSGATTVLAAATDGYVLQSNGTSVVYGTLDGGTF